MKKKVMLGMSGGVDSSVAAILLLEQGYQVTGVTLKLRNDEDMDISPSGGCCSIDDINDARRVAYKLGIDHIVMNFTDLFSDKVINYFVSEYSDGKTPNPCIACNRHIKFDAMLKRALSLDFDYIATGHYAEIYFDTQIQRWGIRKSKCSKDQSYVLYNMSQFALSHTLMPLAHYEKSKIREIAQKYNLSVSSKPDSQEICFVKNNDYSSFIKEYTGRHFEKGNFISKSGDVIGEHKGIVHYTIGQRKNLGVSFGKRMYVTRIHAKNNTVTLGEEGFQFSSSLICEDLNFILFDSLTAPLKVKAKIRYQSALADAAIYPLEGGKVKVVFDVPQKSISPGQSVVFYDNDIVVGGGIII